MHKSVRDRDAMLTRAELSEKLLPRLDPSGPLNELLRNACETLTDIDLIDAAVIHRLPDIRLALDKPSRERDRREWPGPGIGVQPRIAADLSVVNEIRSRIGPLFDSENENPSIEPQLCELDGHVATSVNLSGIGLLIISGRMSESEMRRIAEDTALLIGPAALASLNGEMLRSMQQKLGKHRSMERRIAESMAKVSNVQQLGKAVNELAEDLFTVEHSGLYFIDPDSMKLTLAYAKGLEDWEMRDAEKTAWDRHPGNVIRTGKIVHIHDTENDPTDSTRTSRRRARIRSRCYLPVFIGSEVVGTLGLASTSLGAFDQEHVSNMRLLTDLAALTWSRLREESTRQKRESIVQSSGACADLLVRTRSWRAATDAVLKLVKNAYGAKTVRLIIFDGEEIPGDKESESPFELTSDMKQKLVADEVDLSPKRADGTHDHIAVPIPVSGYSWGSLILESVGSHTTFDDIVIASLRNVADSLGSAITREELQTKLMHAHKMEAVGMLAGGIAHDFNNLLWPILAYSETLKEQARSENESAMLTDINVAATRAASLVEEILFMSRRRVTTNDPVCLRDVVKEVIDIGAVPLPPTLELKTDLQEDAGAVLGDRTAIHRLVLNLITNARAAMLESTGIIKVTVRQAQVTEQLPHQTDTLILEVKDEGVGMTEKVRSRLFEPYFTTRRGGRGTGLGLTIVHRVTTELGGDIQIESEPGAGSTFQVRLPRTAQVPTVPEPSSSPAPRGEGRIMIVDDDAAVLTTASQMVESLGYTVQAFGDSTEALKILQNADHRDPGIDLVLTDLTMPNLDGMQLARETSLLHPDLPILLITGFGDEVNASAAPITQLLRKPISRSDLADAIQDAISLKSD